LKILAKSAISELANQSLCTGVVCVDEPVVSRSASRRRSHGIRHPRSLSTNLLCDCRNPAQPRWPCFGPLVPPTWTRRTHCRAADRFSQWAPQPSGAGKQAATLHLARMLATLLNSSLLKPKSYRHKNLSTVYNSPPKTRLSRDSRRGRLGSGHRAKRHSCHGLKFKTMWDYQPREHTLY